MCANDRTHDFRQRRCKIILSVAIALIYCGTATTSVANGHRYRGICEASGDAFVDSERFAVASDESNIIRIYERGSPDIVGSVDLSDFTGHDKSDLEAAAVGEGVIYWTASQSQSKGGKDQKRKVIFKTRIVTNGGAITLEADGVVREDLKAQLVELSGSTDDNINVEGLASTREGGLLFGLRNVVDRNAVVVKLTNAEDVLAANENLAEFGWIAKLDLKGRGIRSMERVGSRYLIVAGRPKDESEIGYALYWWDGEPEHKAEIWEDQPDFTGLDPEIVMPSQDGTALLFVSDDGDRCSEVEDEDTPSFDRSFSVIEVRF